MLPAPSLADTKQCKHLPPRSQHPDDQPAPKELKTTRSDLLVNLVNDDRLYAFYLRKDLGGKLSVSQGKIRPPDENPIVAPLDLKDKDTGSSPPLGSRKVTFLDSPSSPFPSTPPRIKRRSLSPEARVQERLTPESETEQTVQKQPQPLPSSRRRVRTLDPSQRLQGLGPIKDKSD